MAGNELKPADRRFVTAALGMMAWGGSTYGLLEDGFR